MIQRAGGWDLETVASSVAGETGVVTKGVARPLSKKSVSSQDAKRKGDATQRRPTCNTKREVAQDDTDLLKCGREGVKREEDVWLSREKELRSK